VAESDDRPIAISARETSGFQLGPGLIMAASGIGASDIITATVTGAKFGRELLWSLLIATFLKFVLSENLARWQLATGQTVLEGWAKHLPRWVLMVFFGYLVIWAIAVSAALVNACGLAVETISNGIVPRTWGAVGHAIAAYWAIRSGTEGNRASRWMRPLIAVMFFTIVACAALTFREPSTAIRGMLIPEIPETAGPYVLSIIGGIGGSVTLLSYHYLLRDEGREGLRHLTWARWDLVISYAFTTIFGLSVMLIAERVFHSPGIAVSDRGAISEMAAHLGVIVGPIGFFIYSAGFWAAVVASLLGVWQTIPSVFADACALLRQLPDSRCREATRRSSPSYRTALLGMALCSVPFAFVGRPVAIVIAFTILGSLFIPFLSATLLYLNNFAIARSGVRRNRVLTNGVLGVILLLFLWIGALEIRALFQS
jgi:Mn2+/Fe2+ NRAMP family transporter